MRLLPATHRAASALVPIALALWGLAPPIAAAQDARAGDLVIQRAWTRATPGGASVAGGYLTVRNGGAVADRLIGGSIAAARRFELHTMSSDGGVMRMRSVAALDIPPGGTLTLAPSSGHIMFTGLLRGLRQGESVAGTLIFEHAGTVPVRFEVEGIGARTPSAAAQEDEAPRSGHAMPGMDPK